MTLEYTAYKLAEEFGLKLLSNGIDRAKEKIVIDGIRNDICQFNERYNDTELDGNAFNEFINLKENQDLIFNHVFMPISFEFSEDRQFINEISKNALSYINQKRVPHSYPIIQDCELIENYFQDLIDLLNRKKFEILSFKENLQIKAIADFVTQNYKKEQEYNIFADVIINNAIDLIDNYQFQEAEKLLNEILENQNVLCDTQKENTLFQKFRLFFKRGTFSEIEKIKNKIERINNRSRFIHEINIIMAIHSNDEEVFISSIKKLKSLNVDQKYIDLKLAHLYISQGKYDQAYEVLCFNNDIKTEFHKSFEARYLFGVILSIQNKHIEAKIQFDTAYSLKNRVVYKYNSLVSESSIELSSRANRYRNDTEYLKYINELIERLLRLKYFIDYFSFNEIKIFWNLILSLSLVEIKRFEELYDAVPNDVKNTNETKSIMASYYMLQENFENARLILNEIWDLSDFNTVHYFTILENESNWDEIIELCSSKGEDIIRSSPVLFSFYLLALCRRNGYEFIRTKIKDMVLNHALIIGVIFRAFNIASENSDSEMQHFIIDHLNQIFDSYLPEEISLISELIYRNQLVNDSLNLLSKGIEKSEIIFQKYLSILQRQIDFSIDKNHVEKIYHFYREGNTDKILLRFLAYYEQRNNNFSKSLQITEIYIKNYGNDEDSAVRKIACKLNLRDYTDLNDEVDLVKNSKQSSNYLIISIYFSKIGEFVEAQKYLLKSIYLAKSDFSIDFIDQVLWVYFSNIDNEEKTEFDKVKNNTVIVLRSKNGLIQIAVHDDLEIDFNDGDKKFGCINYKRDHPESLQLKLRGEKGKEIRYFGEIYIIEQIISIHTYFTRYFLSLLDHMPEEESAFKKFSVNDKEDFFEKIRSTLRPYDEVKRKIINEYNSSDGIGIPLNLLAGNDNLKYIDAIHHLLLTPEQHLFAGPCKVYKNEEYVFSLSTIIVAVFFNIDGEILDKCESIFIANSTKKFILQSANEAMRQIDSVSAHISTNKKGELTTTVYNKEDKDYLRTMWANMVNFINSPKIQVVNEVINNDFIDQEIINVFMYNDLESIQISINRSCVLVCEDKLIRDFFQLISVNSKSSNIAGYIISEKTLSDIDEDNLIKRLVESRYLYPVNYVKLLEVINEIGKTDDNQLKLIRFENWKRIYSTIFDDISRQFYMEIYDELKANFELMNVSPLDLYIFLQKPLNLQIII